MLSATIELLGANKGNVQLLDPERRVLTIPVAKIMYGYGAGAGTGGVGDTGARGEGGGGGEGCGLFPWVL